MTMTLAAALYTIRRQMTSAAEVEDGLRRLRDIGYQGVEVSGVPLLEGPDPAISTREFKRMADDAGLACLGAHARWREIRDDTSAVIDRLALLDCPMVTVSAFVDEYDRFEPASYATFAGEAAMVAQILGEHGIRLGYHNHAHEFLRFGAQRKTMFDVVIDEPSVALEIDVYWAAFAGVDPASLIERTARAGAAAALQGPGDDPRRRGRRASVLCAGRRGQPGLGAHSGRQLCCGDPSLGRRAGRVLA